MTIVLTDEYGVRHEVDFPSYTLCMAWQVQSAGSSIGRGVTVRCVEVGTVNRVNVLGGHRLVYSAAKAIVWAVGTETPFGPSDEPITCIACIGASR